jgi:large repetitive protein
MRIDKSLRQYMASGRRRNRYLALLVGTALILSFLSTAPALAENIDSSSHYAYGENVGWINFKPSQGPGVTVTDSVLTGYAWGENIGWIKLDPANGGVLNDGAGNLSGYAWGENIGWINFAPSGGGVKINTSTGVFSGYAWGENIGWINFAPSNGGVTTSWRPAPTTGTLIVIKHVVNNNGGTKTAADFSIHVKSSGTDVSGSPAFGAEGGSTYTLTPGSYVVSEDAPPFGYAQVGFSGNCDGTGTVTVVAGATKTCTITNDDIQPKLVVIKHVTNDSGGSAAAAAFTMTVTGSSPSPAAFSGNESGTTVTLNAGAYSVGESGPTGYSRSDSSDCSGSIAIGETKTCTITNDDQAATLIVKKHVVNDNGGSATAATFTMSVPGGSPSSFAGSETGTTVTLNAGSYGVGETGPSGYTRSDSADCAGSIANGQTKTCTITNDDQAATLIVKKHVVNDNGGSATAANFTMSVPGGTPSSFAGAEAGTTVTLNAGSYSVGESGPGGYTRSDSADCTGTIANGQTKTCTVTNDDQAATLIVKKHVVNDNGGSATAANFTMSVPGGTPSSFAGAEAGTTTTLNAGLYSVSETGPAGYTRSDSADCAGSIANGQTKTCTITNDDQAATLIVKKHLINDNGGSATAANFTMSVPGGSPSSFAGSEAGTSVAINAGSYSVGETGPGGYTRSDSADCTGTIANGQTKTCTITNDDVQPKLIVIKHVINNDGGTATAANFTMAVTGNSPSPVSFPGQESPGTTVTLNAGAYNVSESGPTNYAMSKSVDCTGSIAVGETKTCTVTNDDLNTTPSNVGDVTGGGWINSSAGAYTQDPSFAGRANFGFVSEYKKGATIPTGQTEFHLNDVNFHFNSTGYGGLVVSGPVAQYQGQGTVNGVAGYSFLVTATDGQAVGGGGVDRFRIKIWNTGGVVYDNSAGSDAIAGGNIVIHK